MDSAEQQALAAFHARYRADLAAGVSRTRGQYLAEVPEGLRPRIARELDLLSGGTSQADAPGPAEVAPDQRLGPYRLLRQLGQGGQGVVFLAVDDRLGRNVALKVLDGPGLGSLRRFRAEAEQLSRLDHPGIATVYDWGQEAGVWFLAMRFYEGESLDRLIARCRFAAGPGTRTPMTRLPSGTTPPAPGVVATRADLERLLQYFERAAYALHFAHQAGLVHRDVKPGNLMVTSDGQPVLLDFGLARSEQGGTLSSVGVGTPEYMSPEQLVPTPDAQARTRLDRRTDVYSLAVTLYEALTLRRPFQASTWDAQYERMTRSELPDPARCNRLVPVDLRAVLERALEPDPARRMATAQELGEELRRVREHEPVHARRAGMLVRLGKWARRRPAVASALLLLVVALGAVIGLVVQTVRAEEILAADTARVAVANATALIGQGLWPEAEAWLDDAAVRRYPDRAAMELLRIEILTGRLRWTEAAHRLEALLTRGDPGHHAARARLYAADRPDERWRKPAAGRDEIESALRTGPLDLADAAYARALLAPTVPAARAALEQCLEQDRRHRRGHQMLAGLLLMTGELDAADRLLVQYEALYPRDAYGASLAAGLTLLRGGRDAGRRHAARVASEHGVAIWPLLSELDSLVQAVVASNRRFALQVVQYGVDDDLDPVELLGALVGALGGVIPAPDTDELGDEALPRADFALRVPPVLQQVWNELRTTAFAAAWQLRNRNQLLTVLDRAIAQSPDGYLRYFRGMTLMTQVRKAEGIRIAARAADDLAAAASASSLFDLRAEACCFGMVAELHVRRSHRDTLDLARDVRIADHARQLLRLERTQPVQLRLAWIYLFDRGQHGNALEILLGWQQRFPMDPGHRVALAEYEEAHGRRGMALELLAQVLADHPDHAWARRTRAKFAKRDAEQKGK